MVAELARNSIEHVLLDIEGTVSDVRFVYNVMFPFAKKNMASFLERRWGSEEVKQAVEQVALDAGQPANRWNSPDGSSDRESLNQHLGQLMSGDSKSTGLKGLQGLVWKEGFESGELVAELFPDVLPAMQEWKALGLQVSIYSSGSVLAQKLFFGHTTQGDLTGLLSGHFDTTTGKKQDSQSYAKIAAALELPAKKILFVSDVAEELIAAQQAEMQVVASIRDGNKPLGASYTGPQVPSFGDIKLI